MVALTDASRHDRDDWLEGRGPELTLVGVQDDATGPILAASGTTSRDPRGSRS
jgi:hypothetical protein